MKVLIWQWGRRGGGPRFAQDLACGFMAASDGRQRYDVTLCIARQSELRAEAMADHVLTVPTYMSMPGFLLRALTSPVLVWRLVRHFRPMRPDMAICAMPGPLDLVMVAAMRFLGVPVTVFVHDWNLHPGDGYRGQLFLQRMLLRHADRVGLLSRHVAEQFTPSGRNRRKMPLIATLPPSLHAHTVPPRHARNDVTRLLFFGRLLPYKGLDLLADALEKLPRDARFMLRIAGQGPPLPELRRLAADPRVEIHNHWIPEAEISDHVAWADCFVMPYREATQSGVIGFATAAGRSVVATRVGGLVEQLRDHDRVRYCAPEAESLASAILAEIGDDRPVSAPAANASAIVAWQALANMVADGLDHNRDI